MRWNLPGTHPLNDLVRNLWAACHLLAFRRSALRWLLPTPVGFFLLFLLSLSASFSFDLISEGWPGDDAKIAAAETLAKLDGPVTGLRRRRSVSDVALPGTAAETATGSRRPDGAETLRKAARRGRKESPRA